MNLGCIVEGHGDEAALPELLRRLVPTLNIPRPVRVPRGKLVQEAEVVRAVQLAASKAGQDARVLILLDADDDCAVELARRIHAWAAGRLGDAERVAVVVAVMEFEAWFLAAAESLRGVRGLRDDLEPPPDPESVRGAKGWLSDRMLGTRVYKETVDQPALAASIDIELAKSRSRSFQKFCREVRRLADS